MQVYETAMKGGIKRNKEFARKKLAAFAVNVGTKCGHPEQWSALQEALYDSPVAGMEGAK